MRTGSARVVLGRFARARLLLATTTSTSAADAVRVERGEVLGERVALGLAGLRGHVADVDARRGRGAQSAAAMPGTSRLGSRLV